MERLSITPRPDFAQRLESIGLSFHSWDDYWKEDVCYRFTLAQVEAIEAAAEELHGLCVEAARHVVAQGRLGQLGIPEAYWNAIADSLRREAFTLYGRFDLAYDGQGPPRLLEYNADTPTSLLESAVAQWYWLEDCCPNADQFNSLHERLVERWRAVPGAGPVHLASLRDNEEDWVTTTYMQETVTQAGREAKYLPIEDIGWDEGRRAFVDLDGQPIETLFKLYPWEWMLREDFGPRVIGSSTTFVEPLWKSVLSCKGILPVLWELFPGHPNLLPAYFEPGRLDAYVKKPLYSREGANIELHQGGRVLSGAAGHYGAEGFVYQGLARMPEMGGKYPVIGAWIVGRESAGMCIREDTSPITTNMSNFVPHYFI